MAVADDVLLGDDVTPIDTKNEPNPNPDPEPKPAPEPEPNPNLNPNPDPEPNPNDNNDLAEGTEVEDPDGNVYTVDASGNLLDKDGKVFKEAKDVKDYLAQFNSSDGGEETPFSITDLQNLVDVDITDENGKAVEFTDDAVGRKAFMDKVIELKQAEASKVAMDTFFIKNPVVKQFADYVSLGGNPRDFGKIPDRTGVKFVADDADQHKQIIRLAFSEKGQAGDVESYIKWLEGSGALADTAKKELEAIQAADKQRFEQIERDARAAQEAELKSQQEYINGIFNTIESGVIGGYKLPENVTVEKNGQKLNYTRRDFFNYVTRIVDKETGKTAYNLDLDAMSDKDYTNRELLDAWIHFTGGSYKTLVDMAIREGEVQKIRLTAKKASKGKGTVVIHKPNNDSGINEVVL